MIAAPELVFLTLHASDAGFEVVEHVPPSAQQDGRIVTRGSSLGVPIEHQWELRRTIPGTQLLLRVRAIDGLFAAIFGVDAVVRKSAGVLSTMKGAAEEKTIAENAAFTSLNQKLISARRDPAEWPSVIAAAEQFQPVAPDLIEMRAAILDLAKVKTKTIPAGADELTRANLQEEKTLGEILANRRYNDASEIFYKRLREQTEHFARERQPKK